MASHWCLADVSIVIAFDDQTSTFIIPAGAGFSVVFCPGGRSTNIIYTSTEKLTELAQSGHVNSKRDMMHSDPRGFDVMKYHSLGIVPSSSPLPPRSPKPDDHSPQLESSLSISPKEEDILSKPPVSVVTGVSRTSSDLTTDLTSATERPIETWADVVRWGPGQGILKPNSGQEGTEAQKTPGAIKANTSGVAPTGVTLVVFVAAGFGAMGVAAGMLFLA